MQVIFHGILKPSMECQLALGSDFLEQMEKANALSRKHNLSYMIGVRNDKYSLLRLMCFKKAKFGSNDNFFIFQ